MINKKELFISLNQTDAYFKHNKNILSKNLIIFKDTQIKNINIDNNSEINNSNFLSEIKNIKSDVDKENKNYYCLNCYKIFPGKEKLNH